MNYFNEGEDDVSSIDTNNLPLEQDLEIVETLRHIKAISLYNIHLKGEY